MSKKKNDVSLNFVHVQHTQHKFILKLHKIYCLMENIFGSTGSTFSILVTLFSLHPQLPSL